MQVKIEIRLLMSINRFNPSRQKIPLKRPLTPFSISKFLNNIHDNPPPYPIKDSKKCSPKIRNILRKYIEN